MAILILICVVHFIAMGTYYNAPIELNNKKEADENCDLFIKVEAVVSIGCLAFKNGGWLIFFLWVSNIALICFRTLKIEKERAKLKEKFDRLEREQEEARAVNRKKVEDKIKAMGLKKFDPNPYYDDAWRECREIRTLLRQKWRTRKAYSTNQIFEDMEVMVGRGNPEECAPPIKILLEREADCKWEIEKLTKKAAQEKDDDKKELMWQERVKLSREMTKYREEVNAWKKEKFGEDAVL